MRELRKRFFLWGYKKYVLIPYLRELKSCPLAYLNNDTEQAMYEKEVLERYDRRTDH